MKAKIIVLNVLFMSILIGLIMIFKTGILKAQDGGIASQDQERKNLIVATVNDHKISLGEYEDFINKNRGRMKQISESHDKVKDILRDYIDYYLLYMEAKRDGLQNNPQINNVRKRMLGNVYEQKEIDNSITPESIPIEEVQKFYQDHLNFYNSPEKIRIRQIIINNEQKARDLLQKILREKVDLRAFMQLAYDNSDELLTKRTRGRTRPFARVEEKRADDPEIDPQVVKAAFSLKRDEEVYSKLVKTDKGFHIILRENIIKAINRPLQEVEEDIRRRLWQEKLGEIREKRYDDLIKAYNVEINEENLNLVVVDTRYIHPVGEKGPSVKKLNPRITPVKRNNSSVEKQNNP